jgi:hypothetical protein
MCGSTCFGRLSAHHQERTAALGASVFTVGKKRLERCWSWSGALQRVNYSCIKIWYVFWLYWASFTVLQYTVLKLCTMILYLSRKLVGSVWKKRFEQIYCFKKQGYVKAIMDPPPAPNMTHFWPWIIYTVVGQVMLPAVAAVERATARIYPHVLKFVRVQQFVLLFIFRWFIPVVVDVYR